MQRISEGAMVKYGTTDRLLVLFSSRPAMRRDQFDYMTFVQDMPHTMLFLRDSEPQYIYHTGIKGLSSSIPETAEFLRYFINRIGAARTSFMGMSSGAYAATLFGHLVGADDVHVQSPVSYCRPDKLNELGGGQIIPGGFQTVHDYALTRPEGTRFLDLAPLVSENQGGCGLLRVWYAGENQNDRLQAMNVAVAPHVHLLPHPSASHMLLGVSLMRDGSLQRDIEADMNTLRSECASAQANAALPETPAVPGASPLG